MTPAEIFNLVGGLVFLAIIIAVYSGSQKRLNDPKNAEFIYLDQLPEIALLEGDGPWGVRIDRQSGSLHKYLEGDGTALDAIDEVVTVFRRAKIEAVILKANTSERLEVVRMFHNHRGRNEGRKIGAAVIRKLNRPAGALGAAGLHEK